MSFSQILDPITWPVGYLMDSGALVETYTSTASYPVEIWTNDAVVECATNGIEVNGNLVSMLSGTGAYKLCVKLDVPRWANVGDVDIDGGRYTSPVFLEKEYLDTVNAEIPSWRYTGIARLHVQAVHGTGKSTRIITDPDTQGIIYSDDGRFYHVSLDSGYMIRITKLKVNVDDCVLSGMEIGQNSKMLAYLLARVVPDPDAVTDSSYSPELEALSEYSTFNYDWHFTYNIANSCSKVVAKFADPLGWAGTDKYYLTTIVSIYFTIPTASAERFGSKPSFQVVTTEEDGRFYPEASRDLYWQSLDADGGSIAAIHPPCGNAAVVCGDGVAVYCAYGSDGLQVVRYTAPGDGEADVEGWGFSPQCILAVDNPEAAPGNFIYRDACGPPSPFEITDRTYSTESSGFTFGPLANIHDNISDHSHHTWTWKWGDKTIDPNYPPIVDNGYPSIFYRPTADACTGVNPQFGPLAFVKYTRYQITLNSKREFYSHDQTTHDKAVAVSASNPDAVIFAMRKSQYRLGLEQNYSRTSSDWLITTEHVSGEYYPPYGDWRTCASQSTHVNHLVSEIDHDETEVTYEISIKGVNPDTYEPTQSDTWEYLLNWNCITPPKVQWFRAMESYGGSMVHSRNALPGPVTYAVEGGFGFAYEGGGVFKYIGWV